MISKTPNQKFGIAIIGAGGIARRHAAALLKMKGVNLLGVFSSDAGRAENFGRQYGLKAYQNLEELLNNPELDAVDIVNIHNQHVTFGLQAARAGKHVIVEKPIDISVAKAKELIIECRRQGVYLATIFQHRFDQTVKRLKKIIDRGQLGQIFLASARLMVNKKQSYYDESGGWRGQKDLAGGGVLINQASHTIDTLTYLFGEAALVYGAIETVNHEIEVEDTGVAVIHFKNNVLATIQATVSAFTRLPKIIEIHGTKGSAIISGENLELHWPEQGRIKRVFNKLKNKFLMRFLDALPYSLSIKRKLKAGYHAENLNAIITAIRKGETPPGAFEQGLKSLEIVEAIYQAQQTKQPVQLRSTIKKAFGGDYYQKYLKEAQANKPKVLLINPLNTSTVNVKFSHIGKNRLRQPLGLAYVSSFLKKITSTQLIDGAILAWDKEKTIKYINSVAPDILIISSSPLDRWQNPDVDISKIFEIINQTHAKNKILIGTHGTVTPDWVFENCCVDFVVRGEPEITCLELTQALLKASNDFSFIPGLSFRVGDKIVHNSDRIFQDNLDEYPCPDYEALPMHLYRYSTNDLPAPFSLMLTSRGCPAQCIFCLKKMMPDKYRARSAENIYQEMKYLADNFNIKSIYFQDWEFLIDKQRVREFCQLIIERPELDMVWGCSARLSSLDVETIALMKRAGCVLINFGLESGSPEILKLSKKGVDLEKTKEIIQFCLAQNINIRSFCLANLPGENKNTLKESARFIVQNNLNIPHINIPIPYPGTELARKINCTSWSGALTKTGMVETELAPAKAQQLLKIYLWQGRFGRLFWLNPKFILHALIILKKKFF